MRSILLLALLLFTAGAFAQIQGKKIKDAIVIFDSVTVNPGDTLYLGSGTDRRGDFVNIYQPPNFLLGAAETSLPRKFSHKYAIIKFFKLQKDKRTGEKTVAIVNPFGGLNYVADLEPAIEANEIVAINSRSFQKKDAAPVATVVVQQQTSVADELTKLKKLYDDGTLTKEEYEAQKKKVLEKN